MFVYRLYVWRNACCFSLQAAVFFAAGMEPTGRLLTRLGKEVASATVACASDVVLSEPLECFKTMRQVGMKWPSSPKVWYSGAPVSMASAVPTVAGQFLAVELLKDLLPGVGFLPELQRASIGGVISSLTATPAELLKLHVRMQAEQADRKPVLAIAKSLIDRAGYRVLLRGITTKAIREGIFASGYLALYQNLFIELNNAGLEGIGLPLLAAVFTAAPVTIITHPFDTLSTLMQEDYAKERGSSTFQHAQRLWQAEGPRGFYAGVSWRFLSICIAMFTMGNVAMHTRESEPRLIE